MSEYNEIYRDEHLLVSTHNDADVAVQVGDPPEDDTPTIVDAAELRDALDGHLAGAESFDPEVYIKEDDDE